MAFDRPAALVYLQNKYAALATLVGQATTDGANGYGPAIDEALLTYGTAYSSLSSPSVADADVRGVMALLRYYALLHFEQRLASKVDFDVAGANAAVTKKKSAQLEQVRGLLAEAASQAAAYGYVVGGSAAWQIGSLNLDFLEPEEVP